MIQKSKPFLAIYNINKQAIEKIKIIETSYGSITAVNYGPFDNGYIMIGLE